MTPEQKADITARALRVRRNGANGDDIVGMSDDILDILLPALEAQEQFAQVLMEKRIAADEARDAYAKHLAAQERECADWRDRAARLQHGYEVMLEELKEAKAKVAAQEEQIAAAELSLAIYDEGRSSEYWEHYPEGVQHDRRPLEIAQERIKRLEEALRRFVNADLNDPHLIIHFNFWRDLARAALAPEATGKATPSLPPGSP